MNKPKFTVQDVLDKLQVSKLAEETAATVLDTSINVSPEPIKSASVIELADSIDKLAEEKVAEWISQGEIVGEVAGKRMWETLNKLAAEAMEKAAAEAIAQTPPPALPTNGADRSLPSPTPFLPTNADAEAISPEAIVGVETPTSQPEVAKTAEQRILFGIWKNFYGENN